MASAFDKGNLIMANKSAYAWFRLTRRKIYPWLVLLIALWQVAWCGGERSQANIRLMVALVKIDVVRVMALINELLW